MSQGMLAQFLPFILLFIVFWFFLIRPQQKQQQAHKEMLESLKKGDRVVTTGGIIAEVVKPEDDYFKVKINDDTIVRVERNYIARKIETA